MKKTGKYNTYDYHPGSAHNIMLGLIPKGSRVLEFGCATGYMTREMVRRLGCEVVGLELVAEAAELAAQWCKRVIVGDAMTLDFPALLGDEKFDVIVFADVLEHLYDPRSMLERVRFFLAETGAVVSSIPNIAHCSVRLSLLGGEFDYRKVGLLDETHIRFFTLKTIHEMYKNAGYSVGRVFRKRVPLRNSEVHYPPLPMDFVRWVENQPEADVYQYITRATPFENQDAESRRLDFPGARQALDDPDLWVEAVKESTLEIVGHVPRDGHFTLLDRSQWTGIADWRSRTAHPLPEMNGEWAGDPANAAQLIAELTRQEVQGNANQVVIAWPAFWWMDQYEEFAEYVHKRYQIVLENERILIYRRK